MGDEHWQYRDAYRYLFKIKNWGNGYVSIMFDGFDDIEEFMRTRQTLMLKHKCGHCDK